MNAFSDRKALNNDIAQRLFDAEARLGAIIFLPAAHDGETAIDSLQEFIDEDIEEKNVQRELMLVWPDFGEMFSRYIQNDEDVYFRRCAVLDLMQSHCPVPYLVKVEYTHKELVSRTDGDEYPYGTYRSGWGRSQWTWVLAQTVEDACDRAVAIAEQQKREAWDAFKKPKHGRRNKRSAAKPKAVSRG